MLTTALDARVCRCGALIPGGRIYFAHVALGPVCLTCAPRGLAVEVTPVRPRRVVLAGQQSDAERTRDVRSAIAADVRRGRGRS